MHTSTTENNLFRPTICESSRGGLLIIHGTQRIHLPDDQVEGFVSELKRVRKRQLVRDCLRIVGRPDCAAPDFGLDPEAA